MANLSVDFAFEGFRLIRNKPWVVVTWGLVTLVLTVAVCAGIYFAAKPFLPQLQNLPTQTDPKVMMGLMAAIIPTYIIVIIVAMLVSAVYHCAVYRAVLGGRGGVGLGYMRIGGDEFRQVGVNFVMFLLFVAAEIAVVLGGIAIYAGVNVAAKQGAAVAAVVVYGIAVIVALIWVAVRLSLYPVQTFETRSINLFGSWRLTKGHFWVLFAGYIIAILLTLLVSEAGGLLSQVIVGGVTGNPFPGGTMPFTPDNTPKDFNAMMAMFTGPAILISIGLRLFLVAPLTLAIANAPAMAAYRTLNGRQPSVAEEVF